MKNPFAVPGKPFVLEWDEWENWHADSKRKYPIRYILSESIPLWFAIAWRRYIHEPWYWLKCRLWYRHNVIYIKTLPPTWNDRDDRILHGMFQVLVDFVELEDPYEFKQTWQEHYDTYAKCDPDFVPGEIVQHAKERADDAQTLKDLYRWWTIERPAMGEESSDAEDQAMLHKLIDIRRNLWT